MPSRKEMLSDNIPMTSPSHMLNWGSVSAFEASFVSAWYNQHSARKETLIVSMISGAHSIIYSKNPEADRAFMRDVLKLPHIDSGDGWLIFALPPSEVAFHDSAKNNIEEFYLVTDDIEELIARMKESEVKCSPVQRRSWGLLTKLKLPGGGNLKVYQPLHVRPKPLKVRGIKRN